VIADGLCVVWWARLADHRPGLDDILSTSEVGRSDRLVRAADRTRQRLGAALLRCAVAELTGSAPADVVVDRTCHRCGRPHGRPVLPGTHLHASVTHSGDLVGVALTRTAPIGLDVERIAPIDVHGLSRIVLDAGDKAPDLVGFYTYWTRKEAVAKATGDGLAAPLAKVRVSGSDEPPALHTYLGRPLQAHLVDLRPDNSYRAAIAVLADRPVPVEERRLANAHREG
jgi:4'-phosphopantetheinyl transferase